MQGDTEAALPGPASVAPKFTRGARAGLLRAGHDAALFGRYVLLGRGLPFLALGLLATGYAALYVWVCDDAFISFRYAMNLARGEGLVFNVGEKVEGYTNFLWVLELAALNKLFSLPLAETAIALSVLATLGVGALTLAFARTGPIVAQRYLVAAIAIGLLAVNQHVAIWTTSGLETRQFTVLVLLGAWLIYKGRGNARLLLGASLVFGAAALTRPEGPLLWASAAAWLVVDTRLRGQRFSWRSAAAFGVPFLVTTLGHYVFRRAYYGEWLPNTYYAKYVRAWPDAGVHYLTAVACDSALYVTLPLILLGALGRWFLRRDTLPLLGALLIFPHAAYLIKIGGDHFSFRPLDFYWPFLALGTAEGIGVIVLVVRLAARRRHVLWNRRWPGVLGVGIACVVAVYASILQVADYVLTYQEREIRGHINPTVTRQNFPLVYLLPFMERVTPVYNDAMAFLTEHAIAVRWKEHKLFIEQQQRDFAAYGEVARRGLPRDAVMPYAFVGIMPFQFPELTVIDTLGLVDKTVARTGARENKDREMAHDRRPPHGYLASRGVNLKVRPAATTVERALMNGEYAVSLAPSLWMPFDVMAPGWAEKAFEGFGLYRRPSFFSGAERVGESKALIDKRALRGTRLISDFETGARGWRLDGSMQTQRGEMPERFPVYNQVGEGRLSSFGGVRRGTKAHGQAVLEPLVPRAGEALAFLLAGGTTEEGGVEVRVEGRPVTTFHGAYPTEPEAFEPVLYDLTPHAGKAVSVRVFDLSEDDFVMVDHFILLGAE